MNVVDVNLDVLGAIMENRISFNLNETRVINITLHVNSDMNLKIQRKSLKPINSNLTSDMDRYLASMDNLDTLSCFLHL
ncbi:unnamed protein product [Linum trigynum]|uniref:Uncharacterized protein n=1 Tax=Linum trigynum TaxID=586398 RepID=A0AAV2DCY9_9ROSI